MTAYDACARCGEKLAEPEEECASCGFNPKTDEPLVMRPLRRLGPGSWQSRDGRWTFTGPRAMIGWGGSNELFWHVHEDGRDDGAFGDRCDTLAEAVAQVEAEYAGR